MERFTKKDGGIFIVPADSIQNVPGGHGGEAVERLAVFESVLEHLAEQQIKIAEQLEILRDEGKTNSVKFKELLGQKMLNTNTLALFEVYGIKF